MAATSFSVTPRTGTGRFMPPADPQVSCDRHEVYAIWCAARAEANIAFDGWAASPGPEAYAAYRAAEDRADAAQDTLALLAA
jgi:hypothetical protein